MKRKLSLLAAGIGLAFTMGLASMPSMAGPVDSKGRPIAVEESDNPRDMLSEKDMMTLALVLGYVSHNYVDEIPKKEFFRVAVDGILSKLDAHTSYMDPAEFKKFNEEMKQDYAGIGVTVSLPSGKGRKGLMVEEVYPGGAADKAGIKSGDLVKAADGKLLDKVLDENVKMVRGEAGSKVKLTVERAGRDIVIVSGRAKVESPSVFGSFCECSGANTYFVRISGFHYDTGKEVADALAKASKFKPKSIVIDLRDNPGGSLPASVEVASLFLADDAVVVSSRERGSPEKFMGAFGSEASKKMRENGAHAQEIDPDFANERMNLRKSWPELASLPVYAMVNAGSASASEIVAAALKDNGRALVVGEKTFGKGSVQTIAPLPNGGALRMTIARYYTPSGKSIQALGVEPDVAVEDSRPWRVSAIERSKARYAEKAPTGFVREADLPRHLGESFETLDEQTEKYEREVAEMMDDARPKANEPYERRFTYGPMGSDGKPDALTAKTLALAKSGAAPKREMAKR